MSAVSRTRGLLVGLLVMSAGGCSLGTFDDDACSDNDQCRASFGFGSVCGAEGFCERVELPARCSVAVPTDLLSAPQKYGNAVVVGTLFRRSIPRGEARERAAKLAAEQMQSEGQMARPIAVIQCDHSLNSAIDGQSETAAAASATEFLVDQLGASAIIGPSTSSQTLETFAQVGPRGVLVMSPSATSVELTSVDQISPTDSAPGLLWRTAPSDQVQGGLIAADMLQRDVQNVAIIRHSGSYGDGLSEVFRETYGGNIVLEEAFETASRLAEAAQLVSLDDSVEEVLFFSSESADVIAFLNIAASNSNFDGKRFFLSDSAASQDVLDGSDSRAFSRVRGTRPQALSENDFAFGVFSGAYAARFQQAPEQHSFTAHTYDATWLVFYGIAWAAAQESRVSGLTIARGLRHVSSGTPLSVVGSSWPEVQSIFAAGEGLDATGASSLLDYDPANEEFVDGSAPVEVWTIDESGAAPEIVSAP